MYISRLFATNDIVSIEFDALNGEVLAFVREDTADNAAKNYFKEGTGILDGVVFVGDEKKHLNIPRYLQIQEDKSLKPTITVTQEDGWAHAELQYPYLMANGEKIDISATVKVIIPKDDCRTQWFLTLENRTEHEVQSGDTLSSIARDTAVEVPGYKSRKRKRNLRGTVVTDKGVQKTMLRMLQVG